jgi:hypothetical protein
MVCEYDVPMLTALKVDEVMMSGVGVTMIAAVADADCAGVLLSVAVAVKVAAPLCVTTPLITPVVDKLRPAGSVPAVTRHL